MLIMGHLYEFEQCFMGLLHCLLLKHLRVPPLYVLVRSNNILELEQEVKLSHVGYRCEVCQSQVLSH